MTKYAKMVTALENGAVGNAKAFAHIADCDFSHAKRCLEEWERRGYVTVTHHPREIVKDTYRLSSTGFPTKFDRVAIPHS